MVVVMVRKQAKQQRFLYTHSSSGEVGSPSTSPPNCHTSHENAYEMEKEKLKEGNEERKDTKQEDENSMVTPQDQSCDETGM